MEEKVRILCISASPVADGTTEKMLSIFATKAFSLGAELEVVRLHEHPPAVVTGRIESWEADSYWAPKLRDCDAFVVATPTYWFQAPSILKQWIENLTPLTYKFELDGKVGGFIVYGPEGGAGNVVQWLGWVANNMGILVPPYGLIWQEGPQKTGNNAWVYKALPGLADNIVALILAVRKAGEAIDESDVTYLGERFKRYRARGKKRIDGGALVEGGMGELEISKLVEGRGDSNEPNNTGTESGQGSQVKSAGPAADAPPDPGSVGKR